MTGEIKQYTADDLKNNLDEFIEFGQKNVEYFADRMARIVEALMEGNMEGAALTLSVVSKESYDAGVRDGSRQ